MIGKFVDRHKRIAKAYGGDTDTVEVSNDRFMAEVGDLGEVK